MCEKGKGAEVRMYGRIKLDCVEAFQTSYPTVYNIYTDNAEITYRQSTFFKHLERQDWAK